MEESRFVRGEVTLLGEWPIWLMSGGGLVGWSMSWIFGGFCGLGVLCDFEWEEGEGLMDVS